MTIAGPLKYEAEILPAWVWLGARTAPAKRIGGPRMERLDSDFHTYFTMYIYPLKTM